MSQNLEKTASTPWDHGTVEIMILHLTTSSLTTYMRGINTIKPTQTMKMTPLQTLGALAPEQTDLSFQ